jgi:site-specific DNA-methyltransferase (adenine-specific)|nr:MAG TPA: ParB protein [Caudoviricetes sp.]
MQIIQKKLADIVPYANNAKKHDQKQINNVAESIKQYGFVQPIVVDSNNIIVIGHCRYEAAKKLKMQTVPCVCVDDLTEEQVKALRIVDNKSNESEWDFDILPDELAELDLSGFDFDFGLPYESDDEDVLEDDELEEEKADTSFIWLGNVTAHGQCGDTSIVVELDEDVAEKVIDYCNTNGVASLVSALREALKL